MRAKKARLTSELSRIIEVVRRAKDLEEIPLFKGSSSEKTHEIDPLANAVSFKSLSTVMRGCMWMHVDAL